MAKSIYTYDYCYYLAKQCIYRQDLRKMSEGAYRTALRNDWFKDYTWLIKTWNIYNYQDCFKIAKTCETRSEFKAKNPTAYATASRNHWIDDYTWIPSKTDFKSQINFVYAYEFPDYNCVYIGRTIDIKKRDDSHRKHLSKTTLRIFLDIVKVELPNPKILFDKLTLLESCIKEGEMVEKYRQAGWNVLNKAKTGRYSSSCGNLKTYMKQPIFSLEECISKAAECETKLDFSKKFSPLYKQCVRLKWFDKYNFVFKGKERGRTYEECFEIAKQFTTYREFENKGGGAYYRSLKKGWLKDYIWMSRKIVQYTLDGDFIRTYDSVSDALNDGYDWHISNVINHKRKQSRGFIWRFAKEVLVDGEIAKHIDVN